MSMWHMQRKFTAFQFVSNVRLIAIDSKSGSVPLMLTQLLYRAEEGDMKERGMNLG
jgi:hypothetical protein